MIAKIFILFQIFIILKVCISAKTETLKNTSFDSENYTLLLNDVQWICHSFSNLATSIEGILPNTTTTEANSVTYGEKVWINILLGVRSLFKGIKETSHNFEQNIKTNSDRQLRQLQQAKDFVHQLIRALANWFARLRKITVEIFQLYNYYIPEVLFGKCMAKYMREAYKSHALYEYPFLLLYDIFRSFMTIISEHYNTAQQMNATREDLIRQNKISQISISEVSKIKTKSIQNMNDMLYLSDILFDNFDELHYWFNCAKTYGVDILLRRLKILLLKK